MTHAEKLADWTEGGTGGENPARIPSRAKCECGHTYSWHQRGECRKHGCPCAAFVEKPIVEVDWEP